ncbi:MAG: hypothetical protein M1834_003242 [Cirrosporium novae-zelandiae]|nr:MAG: hypothetical protein M1834_003242 [Cirrosporium novae-zelandiae]
MSTREQTFKSKVALITGSSRGIGAAIALRLAEHGSSVVINYASSAGTAETLVERIRGLGVRAIAVKANVAIRAEIKALFEAAQKEFGVIHFVISNSGIEHFGSLEETTEEEIDRIFAVNVKAQYFVAQEANKYLANNGRLILTSSISAQKGFPKHAIYSASKAAVQGMVRCLAWDLGSRGITVNCIAAGGIKTDMYAEASAKYLPGGDKMTIEEIDAVLSKWSPMNRPGLPDDVAGFISLLMSEESQWMTGQTFSVSGGALM